MFKLIFYTRDLQVSMKEHHTKYSLDYDCAGENVYFKVFGQWLEKPRPIIKYLYVYEGNCLN